LIELADYRKPKPSKPATDSERLTFYQELMGFAVERGYKPGWAAVQFKERFGDWPARMWNNFTPRKPSPATVNWIKSRWIARAKSQDKAHAQ
jgi:hypothetical protein